MSENTTPTVPAASTKKKGKKVTVPRWAALAALALILVLFVSAVSGRTAPSNEAAPAPAATAPETIVETVEVATVPDACLVALDAADEGFTIAAEAMGYASAGFMAASEYDLAALQAAQEGIVASSDKLAPVSPQYTTNRDACRAAK